MAITKVTNSLVATNAIQGTLIADNAITSVHIAQNQVTSVQIPDGSITSTQIAANSIDTAELVTGSIDTIHLSNNIVTEPKIANNSVRTAAIAQNQITSKHIADGSITDTQLGSGAFTMGNITTTGAIRGPASLTIDPATVGDNTGTVVIAGNLQVDGTTTTVNSTTLDVADKNITLGKGGSASANNGGGITIDGAAATLLYTHSTTSWDMNRPLNVVSGTAGATVATFEGTYSGSGNVKLASFERSGSAVSAAVTYTDATTDMEFGTTTGHSLSLTTGNTRKLTITNAGDVTIASGIFTSIHDITTINKFKTTNSNTRSIISMESKDSSGNAVDLRMHALGDGPRGEVYTYTNHPLAFATNNAAPQMMLLTNGNFGIDEDTPATRLHVVGGRASGTMYNTAVFAGGQNSTSGSGARLYISGCENDPIARGTIIEGKMNDNGNSHELNFYTSGNSQAPAKRLTIDNNGRVGIGTDTPQHEFIVASAGTTTIGIIGSGYNDALALRFGGGDLTNPLGNGNSGAAIISQQAVASGQAKGDLQFQINTGDSLTTALFINNDGSIIPSNRGGGAANVHLGSSAGLSMNSSAQGNTLIGFNAGRLITSSTENTALGSYALEDSGSGSGNTAIGREAMLQNQSGTENVAVGKLALAVNTAGGNNVAIGNEALRLKTSSNNVAVGHEALYTAGTGNNVAVGRHAGYATTSSSNTFVGYESGLNNTSGINTAVGHRSLRQNEAGGGNVAVGNDTMYYNTSGSYNVAVGNASNQANTTGSRNVCIGQQAGEYNTGTLVTAIGNQAAQGLNGNTNAGSYSVFVGGYAGQEINTGQLNTFLGYGAGQEVTTGGKNTLVGRYDGNAGGLDIRTASNNVVLSDGDGNIRLHINNSGNAAIGAINSTYHKLHVGGATKLDATTKDSSISGGLVLQTPTYSEYHFTWGGLANHVVELTCTSYFMAIVEYMTFQTNAGGDSNGIQEYHRGKWANNHTTHTWHEFESSGSTTSISNSISAGANTTTNSGKLTISETYGSGSYSGANLVVKIYFGEAGFDISKTT